MGERQSGKKKQSSKKNQKSRQIQSGRKEQATETKESIRVLGRVIRYMAVNYKLAVVLHHTVRRSHPEGNGVHTVTGG